MVTHIFWVGGFRECPEDVKSDATERRRSTVSWTFNDPPPPPQTSARCSRLMPLSIAGECVCDSGWYRSDCSKACDANDCFPVGVYNPAPRAQCSPQGECECQSTAQGRWAGPFCNYCEVGFWGLNCDRTCPCSGHGSCGWLDGTCECFQDGVNGHWQVCVCVGGGGWVGGWVGVWGVQSVPPACHAHFLMGGG